MTAGVILNGSAGGKPTAVASGAPQVKPTGTLGASK
jgi:hypothetical protein